MQGVGPLAQGAGPPAQEAGTLAQGAGLPAQGAGPPAQGGGPPVQGAGPSSAQGAERLLYLKNLKAFMNDVEGTVTFKNGIMNFSKDY